MRKRIYIAGPITQGDLATNINQATQAFVTLALAGYAPFCPHWSCYSGLGAAEWHETYTGKYVSAEAAVCPNELKHKDWYEVDLSWVAVADAVLRLPGPSTGADGEVEEAIRLGIPVFYGIDMLMQKVSMS